MQVREARLASRHRVPRGTWHRSPGVDLPKGFRPLQPGRETHLPTAVLQLWSKNEHLYQGLQRPKKK
eukprot:s2924_g12.t1